MRFKLASSAGFSLHQRAMSSNVAPASLAIDHVAGNPSCTHKVGPFFIPLTKCNTEIKYDMKRGRRLDNSAQDQSITAVWLNDNRLDAQGRLEFEIVNMLTVPNSFLCSVRKRTEDLLTQVSRYTLSPILTRTRFLQSLN